MYTRDRMHMSDEELTRLAATMCIHDPAVDNGAFSSLKNPEAIVWLSLLGMKEVDPDLKRTSTLSEQAKKDLTVKKLRLALWDVQRLDLLFPKQVFSETPNLRLTCLPSWPKWQDAHPELRTNKIGPVKFYANTERLNSYVMMHFKTMSFTQAETVQGVPLNPRKNIMGAWIGTKKIMGCASLDITREGGKDTPFVTYFSTDKGPGTSMMVMEILDVKQVSWPEPDPKVEQEYKYGDSADGPLNPMMQTPKIPLVIVRYTYIEGNPPGGLQFMLHLESILKKRLPPETSTAAVRRALEKHVKSGQEMPEAHLRMFARLLSHNAGLVDCEWASDLQSLWNISEEVAKETRISFFVPCPRMRFRALEEIETGKPAVAVTDCAACGKHAPKLMCSACKSVCYCGAACSTAHWPAHKPLCRVSHTLRTAPELLPPHTLYVPMLSTGNSVLDHGFTHPQEAVRMGGAPMGTCPRNEYGETRFVCRATVPLAGTGVWDSEQGSMVLTGGKGTAFFCDRRRSVQVSVSPGDVPFHAAGHAMFAQLMARSLSTQGQLLYLWARRVGDCLEIDLKDIPKQEDFCWE